MAPLVLAAGQLTPTVTNACTRPGQDLCTIDKKLHSNYHNALVNASFVLR